MQLPSEHEKPKSDGKSTIEKSFAREALTHYGTVCDFHALLPSAFKEQGKQRSQVEQVLDGITGAKYEAELTPAGKFVVRKDGHQVHNVYFFYGSGAIEADLKKDKIKFVDLRVFGQETLAAMGVVFV